MTCCLLYRTDTFTERHQQVLCDCQQLPCMHRDCILEPIQVYRKQEDTVRALRPYPSLLSSWPSSVCARPLQLLSVLPLAPSVGQNSLSIPSTQDYTGQSFAKLRTCRFSHSVQEQNTSCFECLKSLWVGSVSEDPSGKIQNVPQQKWET